MREEHALAQQADALHVGRGPEPALRPDAIDLALALRQMQGDEQVALAGHAIDRDQQIRRAAVGGMGAENDADAATGAFVELREQALEGLEPGRAFDAALCGIGDLPVADASRRREQVWRAVEPQPPALRKIEDHLLARTELVEERGRAALHDLQQPERHHRL